jgi:hypothetical protein
MPIDVPLSDQYPTDQTKMKLTETQLATIETYLLSWELQFRDFYDEMFDHFCTEIEQRMTAGTSFDNALAETSNLFSEHEYRVGLSPMEYGLKAYEREWTLKFKKRNSKLIINGMKKQLFSFKILIWALIYSAIYQATLYFEMPKTWGYLLIPSTVLMLFSYRYIVSWKTYTWANLFTETKVHKSKETLRSNPYTFIHQVCFLVSLLNLFLNVPRLFFDEYSISSISLYLGAGFSVFMMVLSFVLYTTVRENFEEQKVRTEAISQ